jgi:hypothetical protein
MCVCAVRAQVLGVEALHTRDVRHTHRLLIKHILALRSISILSHTKCVLILESNLAFESQHLLHALEAAGVKNWVSMSEGQQGSLGWLTTHERKVRDYSLNVAIALLTHKPFAITHAGANVSATA